MKKFPKLLIVLVVALLFLLGSVVSAFELLYEKAGKAYYQTRDGTIIVHEISEKSSGLEFLHEDKEHKIKYYRAPDGRTIGEIKQGGLLSNAPDYDWWYGCSPTSAGMLMGYYDINGYSGLVYPNLVPGGIAELNTFGDPSAIANDTIASSGHIADFWGDPDPLGSGRTLPGDYECCGDFMCTSSKQSPCDNDDGSTTFFYDGAGDKLDAETVYSWGASSYDKSGMCGIGEYVQYAGYNYVANSLYSQLIYPNPYFSNAYGFTYNDFKTEVDAGRPALVHIVGHTMLGYGYADPSTIYIRDTWVSGGQNNGGTMTWGASYGGADHIMTTNMTPSGGDQPPPQAVVAPMLLLLLD